MKIPRRKKRHGSWWRRRPGTQKRCRRNSLNWDRSWIRKRGRSRSFGFTRCMDEYSGATRWKRHGNGWGPIKAHPAWTAYRSRWSRKAKAGSNDFWMRSSSRWSRKRTGRNRCGEYGSRKQMESCVHWAYRRYEIAWSRWRRCWSWSRYSKRISWIVAMDSAASDRPMMPWRKFRRI